MHHLFTVLFAVVLVLAACGTAEHVALGDGRHRVSFSDPAGLSAATDATLTIDLKLREVCPRGYRKIDERVTAEPGKDRVYTWTVRCL